MLSELNTVAPDENAGVLQASMHICFIYMSILHVTWFNIERQLLKSNSEAHDALIGTLLLPVLASGLS